MKATGSLIIKIIVAIVVIWLALKLLGFALKLAGILIVIGLGVGAVVVGQRLLGGRR
jgi:hypothetical protein